MASKGNNQTIGNAGLFFVCHHLSRKGWNVMPTSRNAKGIDIVAYPEEASGKFVSVQVKTLSSPPYNVDLGKDGELLANFLVVVVMERIEGSADGSPQASNPVAYVLSKDEVKMRMKYDHFLPRPAYTQECYKDNWDKITPEG